MEVIQVTFFFQVLMLSPSPQRSVSRFPPRLSYATSFLPFHPPALNQPVRTRRLERRMRMMRRRRRTLSKEGVASEDQEEEEGGEGPQWWWPRMKRRCFPILCWWKRWIKRTRLTKTVRKAGRRFEESWTGFKHKHTNLQSCQIKLRYTTILASFSNSFQIDESIGSKIHWCCTNCHMALP